MRTFLLLLVAVLVAIPAFGARVQLRLESAYLGDGLFRYSIRVTDDPFFRYFNLGSFSLANAAGVQTATGPVNWTPAGAGSSAWNYAGNLDEIRSRPYEATFFVRSSHSSFKKAQTSAYVTFAFLSLGGIHGIIEPLKVTGFWPADVLVPCPPEEADGSPAELLSSQVAFNFLPDVQISSLLRTNGRPSGISYSYPELSTVRLEATRDFQQWTNVAYIFGTPGVTAWTGGEPLDQFGDFYRLRLVAEGHATTLPPLNSALPVLSAAADGEKLSTASTPDAGVKVVRVRPTSDGVEVSFETTVGREYRVEVVDFANNPLASVSMRAVQGTSQVFLRGASDRGGLIKVTELIAP